MNDDILRMAREAGCEIRNGHAYNPYTGSLDQMLKRFAALVRADEREACAKVCEETDLVDYEHCMVLHTDGHATLRNAAAAIRARSERC